MSFEEEVELMSDELLNYEYEYDMKPEPKERTGLVVIFNNVTFKVNCLPTRKGSDKDVASIKSVFGDHFGFEVKELRNKTKEEMEEELKKIAGTFKPAWRCFVCFFLSHGYNEEHLADFKGARVNVRLLVQLFDGDNCSKMIGKPKLFFAQMCRGFDREEYQRSKAYDSAEEELFSESVPANISPDRDRLVCYATTPGRMARMDSENGSLFVQTLAAVLKKFSGKKKIEDVLSAVTRIVDKKSEEEYKVCPIFESTLVGRLVFTAYTPKATEQVPVVPLVTRFKNNKHLLELFEKLKVNME